MMKGVSSLSSFSDLQDGVGTQSREIGVEEKESKSGKSQASSNAGKSPQEDGKEKDETRDRDRLHITRIHHNYCWKRAPSVDVSPTSYQTGG